MIPMGLNGGNMDQMNVRNFANKYVPLEYRKRWWKLMREWDKNPDVHNAFYNKDVMYMKLTEAKEIV
jgi:hypothetical protein